MTRCTHDVTVCETRWRTDGQACCGVCSHKPQGADGRHHSNRCHWSNGVRVLATHLKTCDSSSCEGCEPCTKRHCTMPHCNRHLRREEATVCTPCIGSVRTNLVRIGELCRVVPTAALERGVVTSEAAVLAGPVPEWSTFDARRRHVLSGGLCRCATRLRLCPDLQTFDGPVCDRAEKCNHLVCRNRTGRGNCPDLLAWLEDAGHDQQHPKWVLGSWDWLATHALGQTRTLKLTVASAVAYLDAVLTDLARTDDFPFPQFATDVADCRTHVEEVLFLADHVEKGAPCPECDRSGRKAKPLERHYAADDQTGDSDLWVCPTCENVWDLEEYDKYVAREFQARAPRLTASQIHDQYRVPEGTLRRWANGWNGRDPIVRKRGKNAQGRQLYDVADVLAARDQKEPETA